MADYNLHKCKDYVCIHALLEDRAEGENVTFREILNSDWATYRPIDILVPADLKPETYNGAYGDAFLATSVAEPKTRLAVYTVGGKKYAYIDYKPLYDANRVPAEYGKTVRARFEIVDAD